MKEDLLQAIQEQVNKEFYSAYLYLAMSSWCEREDFKGFASWFRVQAQEELFHATFMHDYLIRRKQTSVMRQIADPANDWQSLQQAFEQVCAHEAQVSASINQIASLALQQHDHASYQFFMQYVDEQVEEEETADYIYKRLIFSQGKPEYIYALDQELGSRTYTQPFGNASATTTA